MLWIINLGILILLGGVCEVQSQVTCADTGEYLEISNAAFASGLQAKADEILLSTQYPLDDSFCTALDSTIESAIDVALTEAAGCTDDEKADVRQGGLNFKNKFCPDGTLDANVKTYIGYLREYTGGDLSSACLVAQYENNMATCRAIADETNPFFLEAMSLPVEKGMPIIAELYMAAGRCIYREALNDFCPNSLEAAKGFLYFLYVHEVPPGTGLSLDEVELVMQINLETRETNRIYLAIFGDPHVKSYLSSEGGPSGQGDFSTCLALGEDVLYLDSSLVKITGTNTGVNNNAASILTEVSITFRDAKGVTLAEYESGSSTTGGPATTFASGATTVNVEGDESLRIEERGDNGVVLIHTTAGFAGYLVKVSNTFALVMRVSESVAALGTGILREGCHSSVVNRTEFLANADKRRRKRATGVCAGVPEEFQETCEFDLVVTGDETLAGEAGVAVQDAEQTLTVYDEELVVTTTTTTEASGVPHPGASLLGLVAGLLITLASM